MSGSDPFTFAAQYPIAATKRCIAEAFSCHGFARSLPRDSKCLLQWAPFGSLRWDRFHAGTLAVSSFYAHSSLVNKALLAECLSAAGEGDLIPETRAIRGTREEALHEARRMACTLGIPCVLKAARGHNALDLQFVAPEPDSEPGSAPATRGQRAPSAPGAGTNASGGGSSAPDRGSSPDWVAQAHVDPLLISPASSGPGHKFHLRANVLLLRGACFVHRDIVCHVATTPFAPTGWQDATAHITNHSTHCRLPAYSRELHTPTLREAESALGADAASGLREAVHEAVGRTVRAAMHGPRSGCWLTANAWEVFGFDFLPKADGGVALLEVNQGPALEGECRPDVCARLADDVAAVVAAPLAHWIEVARAAVQSGERRPDELLAAAGSVCGPSPAAPAHWSRVWVSDEPAPLFDSRLLGYVAHRMLIEAEEDEEDEEDGG